MKKPLVWVTAYDAWSSMLAQEAGVDALLVGDSVANVLLGYPSTRNLSLSESLHHLRAALRGAPRLPVIADVPWALLKLSTPKALAALRLLTREGSKAVKIEWSNPGARLARECSKARVSFVGHVGLTPQTLTPGQWKKRGFTAAASREILRQSRQFESWGAEAVVLECVPSEVAAKITQSLSIPTIGIGSGPRCTGQILVFHDLTGLSPASFRPRFLKRFGNAREICLKALRAYAGEVRGRVYPSKKYSFELPPEERRLWRAA